MNRNNTILSIFFSVIFLIYLVLDYYGYIRMIKLRRSSSSYLDKYPKLDKADKHRVVVTFSCNPEDVSTSFLNSLLDQSVRVDDIAMTVKYKDTGKISDEIKKIASINGYSKSYGESDKIVYPLLREPDANTKIIVVNPKYVYNKEFIQDMVDTSNNNPKKCIISKDGVNCGFLIKPAFYNEIERQGSVDSFLKDYVVAEDSGNKVV